MKIFIAILVFSYLCMFSNPIYACDKQAANQIFQAMKTNYGLKTESMSSTLHIDISGSKWYGMSQSNKYRFIELIGDADACIHGKARGIFIYAGGEKVAEANPRSGFRVIK